MIVVGGEEKRTFLFLFSFFFLVGVIWSHIVGIERIVRIPFVVRVLRNERFTLYSLVRTVSDGFNVFHLDVFFGRLERSGRTGLFVEKDVFIFLSFPFSDVLSICALRRPDNSNVF